MLPNPLPVVLGHEGAGTVREVGANVRSVAVGDRVVLSWLGQCRRCRFCVNGQPTLCEVASAAMGRGTMLDGSTRFREGSESVYHMAGLGTFSRFSVVPEDCATKIPDHLDFDKAALLGCGVLTGFGAVVNTAQVRVGESVAVIGCGGVGLNAVQGARLSGASTIIAIDRNEERLQLAVDLGATHTLLADDAVAKSVRSMTGGLGVDVSLEVVGRQETIESAVAMTRRGGRIILVGAGPKSVVVNVPAFSGIVVAGKSIHGSFYGSSDIKRDIPKLIALYETGLLKLDELVTQRFDFVDSEAALAYCQDERGARAVVMMVG